MKRKLWLAATIICLALVCVCAFAAADGLVLKSESGTVLNGGSLSGRFYYKVYVEGLPAEQNGVMLGWNEDMNSTAPYNNEWETRMTGQDAKGKYLEIIPEVFGDYDQEIMYAKADEDSPVITLELHYDREPVSSARPRVTTTGAPAIGQSDFMINWTSVSGADYYYAQWILPNGDSISYLTGGPFVRLDSGWSDQEPVAFAGDYCFQVVPLVNGHIGSQGNDKGFWVDPPEADRRVRLGTDRIDRYSQDNQMWIEFGESITYYISAPGADEVRFNNGEWIEDVQLDENGDAEIFWMPERDNWLNGERQYIAYAQARFGNEWVSSNSFFTKVHMGEEIKGEINWAITGGTTVTRNGLVTIEVDPIENEHVDFFSAYIPQGYGWITDSHWVEANNEGKTVITMPVAGCEPGTYDVYVYAVRLGSPNSYCPQSRQVTVTDIDPAYAYNPIILSMKDEYETGEPLRIRAWYDNALNLSEDAWMHVTVRTVQIDGEEGTLGEELFSDDQGFDFWESNFRIDYEGDYVLSASIWQHVDGEPVEIAETKSMFMFTVSAEDQLAVPDVAMNDRAWTNQDHLAITIGEVAHAEGYGYWLHSEEDRESLRNEMIDQPGTMDIDLQGLEPGAYWVEVDVVGRNYNAAHATVHFMLQDPNDKDRSGNGYYFSVGAEEDGHGNLYAAAGEGIRFIYYVPGAEHVQMFYYDENQEEQQIEHGNGPGVRGWRTWNGIGTYTIYGQSENGGNWGNPVELCQIAIMGRLDEPNADVPLFINAGEDAEIRFNGNEHATWYHYWMSPEGSDQEITEDGNNEAIINPLVKTIESGYLEANHAYGIHLDIGADGYMNGHSDRTLYVLGQDDTTGAIWLEVPETITVGCAFDVYAEAIGAEEIYLIWSAREWEDNRRDGSRIEDTYCIDDPVDGNTITFTAFARVNGDQVLVKRVQSTVTGAENAERAAAPTLTISDRTVARNDYIEATVGEVTGAYEYHVNVFDMTNEHNWYGDYRQDEPGVFQIPTANLPEGQYVLGAWVRVPGKYTGDTGHNGDDASHIVTITECENRFIVSKDTVEVREPLTVSICAPGAERIRFSSGYDRWDNDEGEDGDGLFKDHVSWDYSSDTVTIMAEAMYEGRWEPIGSKRITITDKGRLAEPDLSGIPATVTAGADKSFTIPRGENVDCYEITIRRLSDNEERWYRNDLGAEEDSLTITVDARFLSEANTGYQMRVTAFGRGYNANEGQAAFVTTGAEQAQHEISLEADRNETQSNEDNVRFTVTAEGATIAKLYFEDRWYWAPAEADGKAEFSVCFNQEGLQPVWAGACYDQTYAGQGWDELNQVDMDNVTFEGMSNIVYISVNSYGETGMPDWASVPAEVTWGELLRLDIGGEGNAERIHIRIWDEEDHEVFFKEILEKGITTYLPTAMLTPGGRYQVSIDGCCTGFTWNHLDADLWFTVTEPEGIPQPFMTSDRDEEGWVLEGSPYYVQMYAPGAVELMAAVSADPEEDVNARWDGQYGVSGRDGFWWDESGTKTLNGYAKYSANGAWQKIGQVTLEVISRQLAQPQINTETTVNGARALDITIPGVPHAENYRLEIHEGGEGTIYEAEKTASKDANDEGEVVFTVPAGTLESGKSYWIDCYVNSDYPGVEGSSNSRMILVNNGNTDGDISLSVNKTWIPVNEDFTVRVNAPGAKAILVHVGDEVRGYPGESMRDQFQRNQPYTEVVYAQGCYDDELVLPENLEWFDWNELEWGMPSEAITLEFYAEGRTGEPDISVPESIRHGEILTVFVQYEGDGANEVHANILWNNPEDGNESWVDGHWTNWNERTREIHLNTMWLEPGRTYWLAADNSGRGLTGNRTWREFEVTANEDPEAIVFSAPESVYLGDVLPVSIYAPGAWRVGFATDGEKWHENGEGEYHWNDGADTWNDAEHLRWENPDDLGEHTITAYAQYSEGGEWVTVNRTVTVLNPDMDAPEIRTDAVVNNSSAVTITVPLVADGVYYNINIHPVNDINDVFADSRNMEEDEAEEGPDGEMVLTFTVPAGTLADGDYWIDCNVGSNKPGLNGSVSHRTIIVRNGQAQTDNGITIEADDTNQPVNQDIPVRVKVTGANARAVLLTYGDNSQGCALDENGEAEIWIRQGQPGTVTLYAQACYDPDAEIPNGFVWNYDWKNNLTWGKISSQMIQMHFFAYGEAPAPEFDAPDSVTQGDVLVIRNIREGEGAGGVHANININGPGEPEEAVYGYGWHNWDEGARTIYMSTSMLEPGVTYWLMVDNDGPGLTTGRGWHEFTVTAREEAQQPENGVVFSAPEAVQAGCIVPINVYAPGAVKTGFGFDLKAGDKNDQSKYELMMDGDIAYNLTDFRWYEPGTVTVTAYALFEGAAQPVTIDRTVAICEGMSFDLSGLPGYFTVGQTNAQVTIPLPEHADGMSIQIHADGDGDRQTLYRGDDLKSTLNYSIPSAWLTEDRQIWIDYYAYGEGFEEIGGGTWITIAAPAGSGAAVELEKGELNNIQSNEEIIFRVKPTGNHTLTAVRFFDGHSYVNGGEEITRENYGEWFNDDGSISFWCNFNHNDETFKVLSVYAQVRVDGSTTWETTNCLQFTVKTPHGAVSGYDFTDLTPITARRGEVVTVEFTEVEYPEGPIHYWADVFSEDERSFNPQTNWDGTTVMISTTNIPAGRYKIRGRAVKDTEPGWRWSESYSDRELIITEEIPEMPSAGFRTPAGLTTIEEEAFMGIAAKTVELTADVQWVHYRAFADSQVKTVIIRNGGMEIDDRAFEGCGTIVVYGPQGSNVHWWAERNLYTFYPIE